MVSILCFVHRAGRLIIPLLVFCFFVLPVQAQELAVEPLGSDPWVIGPESQTNGSFLLASPNPVNGCQSPVSLWVSDIGVAIYDLRGQVEMLVNGDTFYPSGRKQETCLASRFIPHSWCRNVSTPFFQDATFFSDCQIDEDCQNGKNGFAYRCYKELSICVSKELYDFCMKLYDPRLLPGLAGFCMEFRGSWEPPSDASAYGQGFCDWLAGDHFCATELYDDTCEPQCMTDGTRPECNDPCDVECIQVCNRDRKCRNRNNVFFDVTLDRKEAGDYVLRLVKQRREFGILREWSEGEGTVLFGIYPVDFFRDRNNDLYLFSDTRTWLSFQVNNEIGRSGIGIYSMRRNERLRFDAYAPLKPKESVWKGNEPPAELRPMESGNPRIVWMRGGKFSEISAIRGMDVSPYDTGNNEKYVHVLGAGPTCALEDPLCLRSVHSGKAYLARIPNRPETIADPTTWEYYGGMRNGKALWHGVKNAAHGQQLATPVFHMTGFQPSSVIPYRGELWHLGVIPGSANSPLDTLQLLRSPDGIHWYDGGTWNPLLHERPLRTRFVYSPHWMQPKEIGGKLAFLLSHWLSYEGYFMASSKQTRFRDYNMKSYKLSPPPPRSFLVHSDYYSQDQTDVLQLPVTVYKAVNDDDLMISMQYCLCSDAALKRDQCQSECAPWISFDPNERGAERWHYAAGIAGSRRFQTSSGHISVISLNKASKNLTLLWNWRHDIKALNEAHLLLRFGLFSASHPMIFEQMSDSLRILPKLFKKDLQLWQNPGGWHVTAPISLKTMVR